MFAIFKATEPHHVDIDNDVVPDGGGDEPERGQAAAAGNKTTREFVMDQPMGKKRVCLWGWGAGIVCNNLSVMRTELLTICSSPSFSAMSGELRYHS